MQALRRTIPKVARVAVAATAKPTIMATRFLGSNILDRHEGEEARWVRKQDEERKKAIRAELERILALEEGHHEKEQVVGLLASAPAKEEELSFAAKYGLEDWKLAFPVGLLFAIPTLANEVYVMNAESQLVAAFLIFIATMYNQTGAMIAKSLDEQRDQIFAQLKKGDDYLLVEINDAIEANQKVLDMEQDVSSIFNLTDDLAVAQADVLNYTSEQKYFDAVVKKLESLKALEDAAFGSIRNRMMATVHKDVLNTFKTDKKIKEAALNQAIAVLTAGPGGKMGKDIVGEVFSKSIKAYTEKYSKQPAGSDEILNQLERDMAAIAQPPAIDHNGGNVYVTHPIINTAKI